MTSVTIAWLPVRTAPAGSLGLFVGFAVAAYALPGILGALTLGASFVAAQRVRWCWPTASCGPGA